jgi:hypothetical protein
MASLIAVVAGGALVHEIGSDVGKTVCARPYTAVANALMVFSLLTIDEIADDIMFDLLIVALQIAAFIADEPLGKSREACIVVAIYAAGFFALVICGWLGW